MILLDDESVSDRPEVPRRSAAGHVHVEQVGVHGTDADCNLLGLVVPLDLEGDPHVYGGAVGDHLAPTAGDLHATKEAKVDSLPDPRPCFHGNVQLGRDDHSVVFQK